MLIPSAFVVAKRLVMVGLLARPGMRAAKQIVSNRGEDAGLVKGRQSRAAW
jgi:hypothetical protein